MVFWLPLLAFSLTACSGSSTRHTPDSWTTSESVSAVVDAEQAYGGSEVAMLSSARSENGFYGTDAQAEINQILRFLEGQ